LKNASSMTLSMWARDSASTWMRHAFHAWNPAEAAPNFFLLMAVCLRSRAARVCNRRAVLYRKAFFRNSGLRRCRGSVAWLTSGLVGSASCIICPR